MPQRPEPRTKVQRLIDETRTSAYVKRSVKNLFNYSVLWEVPEVHRKIPNYLFKI